MNEQAMITNGIADDYVDLVEGCGYSHEEAIEELQKIAAECGTPSKLFSLGIEDGKDYVDSLRE